MKKFYILILSIFLFLLHSCNFFNDPITNYGVYNNITYNGYNAVFDNVQNINALNDYATLTLFCGTDTFENITFDCEYKYINSIYINFSDTLSLPNDNCYTVIFAYSKNNKLINLYDSKTDGLQDFSLGKTFFIDENIKSLKLHFSSNNSDKMQRKIKLYNVLFQ